MRIAVLALHVLARTTPPCGALGAAGLLTACAATVVSAQTLGTVTGRVTSSDDNTPVQSASVQVVGTQYGALTGANGSYRLQLRPGTYELRVRLIGYGTTQETVVVTDGGAVTQDFRLSKAASALQAVAVVGSRTEARTVIESPVPVDVLSAAEIRSTGRTETAQILQQLAPSVNFPRATISDGTDHVRPATLRGLAPDQVLVLINGRRRHTSALVNVNGSIGRGSSAVDLNAIPASMIDRIEVLRDGAAAQYGSDAIAGVINIILKSNSPGDVSATFGQTSTTYGTEFGPGRSANDGGVLQASANAGLSRMQGGFLHGGVEYRDREATNRTLGDPRPQSFADQIAGRTYTNETGNINHRQGDAATTDVVALANGGYTLANGLELYAFGGFGRREGEAAGFFRRAQDDRTVRSLHPNGFLPLIRSEIMDGSAVAGVRGRIGGWRWDASTGYGRNSFRFDVANSNNVTLGNASPTDFYVGTLNNGQWSTNVDLAREVMLGGQPLRLATGAEFRVDQYRIEAGEEDSYRNGGISILDTLGRPTGRQGQLGAQVFPGFQPTDAADESRNNVALYADAEADITARFLLGAAARFENYSDFGATTTFKATSRLTLLPGFVLRGAASTGFRAPSLQQSFYSATATNFITVNGSLQPFEVKTAPVGSAIALALGSRPLEPEKSLNFSLGFALEPLRSMAITVDAYRISIDDRIVLSENFTGAAVQAKLAPLGAAAARYFTNAIDTRTDGIDVVLNYGLSLDRLGFVRLTGGYNHNKTEVTRVSDTPPELGEQREALFGRTEEGRVEEGQPRDNVLLSANYEYRTTGFVLRTQRFGEVTSRNAPSSAANDQTFGAKWVTDVSASFRALDRVTLTIGADNVFDVYPDQNDKPGSATVSGNSNFGIFPYSQFSPFGFNGRFLFARFSYRL
jgi:iron complex outermembrane receptor protein